MEKYHTKIKKKLLYWVNYRIDTAVKRMNGIEDRARETIETIKDLEKILNCAYELYETTIKLCNTYESLAPEDTSMQNK